MESFLSLAWADSALELVAGGVAGESVFSPAVQRAFVLVAGFVERASAPAVVFEFRWRLAWPPVGAVVPAVAEAFDVPDFVSSRAFPVAVDISGSWPRWRLHCSAARTYGAEGRRHDCWRYLPDEHYLKPPFVPESRWVLRRYLLDELHLQPPCAAGPGKERRPAWRVRHC